MMNIRQGDVLLKAVSAIPERATILDTKILAEGEVTGHAHRIDAAGCLFRFEDKTYLRVQEHIACLSHEEHAKQEVPIGDYEVIIQREYDDEQEWRNVQD